ncbi:MAG: DUF5011 domain-containing protein [Candidatus Peribacteria bacterium]|jgi:hypothetical protein|nr:DUF5011 domain-containing protein [Candidatus Peribacteria bacterium]
MTIEVYGNFIDPGANWTDTDGGSGQIFPERGSIDWYTSSNEMLVKLDALNKDGLGDGERDSAQVNIWKNLAPDTTSAGNTDFNLSNVIDNTSSLYMNGTNSNIVSSAPLSFTGHDSLSVEIVFKPENITAVGMLFENGTAWNSSDGGFGAVYNTTSSGAPDGLGIVHTNYNASPSRASFPANYAWNNTSTYQTHTNIYTIVADPDGRQVYIGGEKKTLIPTSSSTGTLSGATPGGGTFGSAPLNFFIGSRADSGFRVKGEILALRIYGKKLSASEVCQNAWADYYRFDTGVAPSCTDPFDIAINGTVDTNIIGEYVLTYIKVDSTGNIGKAYRTVYVVDTTPPVLTINTGTDSIDMYSGRTDAGAEWSDNYDTGTGIVYAYSGTVNTGVAGSYQVDYCRVDTNGNTGYTSRTVIVQDTELPMITLSGANPQYIEVNTAYVELGASVQDNYDTGLIATIDASEVNTSVL